MVVVKDMNELLERVSEIERRIRCRETTDLRTVMGELQDLMRDCLPKNDVLRACPHRSPMVPVEVHLLTVDTPEEVELAKEAFEGTHLRAYGTRQPKGFLVWVQTDRDMSKEQLRHEAFGMLLFSGR